MKLAIIGAGGLGRVVAEMARRIEGVTVVGFIDDAAPAGSAVLGLEVLGPSSQLAELRSRGTIEAVAVAIGNPACRQRLAEQARAAGCELPALADPSAVVSPSAQRGPGSLVGPLAVVAAGASLGALAIVAAGAVIEHDAVVEPASYVGPRALVDARGRIGRGLALAGGTTIGQDGVVET